MDTFETGVYARELATQARFALGAATQLNHCLNTMKTGAFSLSREQQESLHSEVFRAIHSLLTHSSNVSRLLWPIHSDQRAKETNEAYAKRALDSPSISRGQTLRAALKITDDHVLKSRRLRDHLEHFDERLDDWRLNSKQKNIASDTIGGANAIVGVEATDAMRWFDPETKSFIFRGEKFNLQDIVTAIDQVRQGAVQLDQETWAARMR